MKRILLSTILALALINTNAQQIVPCGTDEIRYQMKQVNPQLAIDEAKGNEQIRVIADALLSNKNFGKKAGIKYIPVVFHVIHNDGMENITQAQIMDQMRILNEDFRKIAGTNGGRSTNPLASDMEFEFRLAQLDPNGNRHDGINRIKSNLTDNAGNNVKNLIRWPSTKYLNVWVVKTININTGTAGTVLGFAQFPTDLASSPNTDGIVMRADYLGNIQTGNTNNAGRTLTHEVGHWVGLYHPFQSGCAGMTANNCNSGGDGVCDTPPVSAANFGSACDAVKNSCTGDNPDLPDMLKNYMDYMDGKCTDVFTIGQKARAVATMQAYRTVVYSAGNLTAAGINAAGDYNPIAASVIKAPYAYGFEDADISTAGWRIQNLNNGVKGWNIDNVGFNGTKSIAMRNYVNTATTHSRDEFSSPLIDLSTLANPVLGFRVASAKKVSGDVLEVFISGDFGRTETKLYSGSPSISLPSAAYVPTSSSDWNAFSFDLTPYKNMTNARIRFELRNLRGNNTFIDDFTISASTGLVDNLKQEMAFNVFPNPMGDAAYAQFELKNAQSVNINICDIAGRKISTLQQGEMQAGMHSLAINRNGLQAGIYLIQVTTKSGTFVHKLVVN